MNSLKNLTKERKEAVYLDWVNNYLTTEKMAIDYNCSQKELIAIIDEVRNMPKPERIEFTRVNNDVNGNPRYVCHFLNFLSPENLKEIRLKHPDQIDLTPEYNAALKKARTIGGRKFHNKQYGGGIVFTAFDTYELETEILKLKGQ